MTKPAPEEQAPASTTMAKTKSAPADAVQDLERRLQMLETPKPAPTTMPEAPVAAAPVAAAPEAAPKTGKNALLARIMAAQERAKQGPPPAEASAAPDLLDSFDAPAESASAPPPAFDASLLPAQAPPPAFDSSALPPPPPVENTTAQSALMFDPMQAPAPTFAAAPAASAPVFEDLLDASDNVKPPPSYDVTPVPAPAPAGMDQEAIDAILGMEGLSDEEKAAMIAEQEKIMASIEAEQRNQKSPANSASARADAFEQRSHAAAVQAIGGSRTKPAPVSSPSVANSAASQEAIDAILGMEGLSDQEKAAMIAEQEKIMASIESAQSTSAAAGEAGAGTLASDMELAEQLQKEEYKKAEKRTAAAKAKAKAEQAQQQGESGWMDWLGFGSSSTSPTTAAGPDRSFAQRPVERGEIAVSLPPGASRNNSALAMAPAYTGQDDDITTPQLSPARETESLMTSSSGGGGARVAEQKPLFSCVADSINEAANQFYTTVNTDSEGNVHGVDQSGLLAMSQAGRENSDQPYQGL
eukprot:CAMPEP_0168779076 /NCGR_PEP_ID=MMETSP0725-20121227/7407_1 /TAXON_ID=265536 /ORGANISM="Amphiprora sp., Strain CCMP467" /LENGTH=527 /DNA_ID=CAMNT_0008828857 /DNA_START=241 /DNA_END=1824 /DNA_ORIENTATION=-